MNYGSIEKKNVSLLNKVVTRLEETRSLKLKYRKLDTNSLRLLVFVESKYSTNADGTSQLVVAIFFPDTNRNCHFLHWSSTKFPRVTRSMLESEIYSFSKSLWRYGRCGAVSHHIT